MWLLLPLLRFETPCWFLNAPEPRLLLLPAWAATPTCVCRVGTTRPLFGRLLSEVPMCPLWFGCSRPRRGSAGTASLYSPRHLCTEGTSELVDWVAMGGGTPAVVACDSVGVGCTTGIKAIVPKFMTTKRLPLFMFLPRRPQDWEYFICQTNCIFYQFILLSLLFGDPWGCPSEHPVRRLEIPRGTRRWSRGTPPSAFTCRT